MPGVLWHGIPRSACGTGSVGRAGAAGWPPLARHNAECLRHGRCRARWHADRPPPLARHNAECLRHGRCRGALARRPAAVAATAPLPASTIFELRLAEYKGRSGREQTMLPANAAADAVCGKRRGREDVLTAERMMAINKENAAIEKRHAQEMAAIHLATAQEQEKSQTRLLDLAQKLRDVKGPAPAASNSSGAARSAPDNGGAGPCDVESETHPVDPAMDTRNDTIAALVERGHANDVLLVKVVRNELCVSGMGKFQNKEIVRCVLDVFNVKSTRHSQCVYGPDGQPKIARGKCKMETCEGFKGLRLASSQHAGPVPLSSEEKRQQTLKDNMAIAARSAYMLRDQLQQTLLEAGTRRRVTCRCAFCTCALHRAGGLSSV